MEESEFNPGPILTRGGNGGKERRFVVAGPAKYWTAVSRKACTPGSRAHCPLPLEHCISEGPREPARTVAAAGMVAMGAGRFAATHAARWARSHKKSWQERRQQSKRARIPSTDFVGLLRVSINVFHSPGRNGA